MDLQVKAAKQVRFITTLSVSLTLLTPVLNTEIARTKQNESERSRTKENEIDIDTKRIVWYDVYVPKEAKKLHRRTRGSFSVMCERRVHRAALFVFSYSSILIFLPPR